MFSFALGKQSTPGRDQTSISVNSLAISTFLLFISCYIPTTMGAVITDKSLTMRLEGMYSFTSTPSFPGATITWAVDRKINNSVTNNFYTASGQNATFDLDWRSGNTTYIIRAEDNGKVDELEVQVFPADQGISYTFKNPYRNSPSILVRVLVPGSLNADTNVVSIHHGSSRSNYFNYWKDWGKTAGWIILAPHFPDNGKWSGSRGYNLGNMFTGSEGTGNLNPEAQWSYRIAVDFAQSFLDGFDLNDKTYDMWGHSAGGQFTHRTMMFVRDAPIRRGMPANPGWWTLPVYENSRNYKYPYGLYHPKLDYDENDIERFTKMYGVINAGDRDTRRTDSLRQTPEADAQGRNRWERANNMYEEIETTNLNHNWDFFRVSGVDHDGERMAQAAQEWLETNPPQPPEAEPLLYFSLRKDGTVGGQAVSTSDIVAFDGNNFNVIFDGSTVALDSERVNAFAVLSDNEILMTFYPSANLPDANGNMFNVTATDIVKLTKTPLGDMIFESFLNGARAGLTTVADQQIDALAIDNEGNVLISVAKTFYPEGIKIRDEDLIQGPRTDGSWNNMWELIYDGSDVGLDTYGWDLKAAAVHKSGKLYLSMRDAVTLPGVAPRNEDVFIFEPIQLGQETTGTYSTSLSFDGSAYGLTNNDICAFDIVPVTSP